MSYDVSIDKHVIKTSSSNSAHMWAKTVPTVQLGIWPGGGDPVKVKQQIKGPPQHERNTIKVLYIVYKI